MDIGYLGQLRNERIKWPEIGLRRRKSGYKSAGHDERDVSNIAIAKVINRPYLRAYSRR